MECNRGGNVSTDGAKTPFVLVTKKLLQGLHDDIHQRLSTSRAVFGHAVTKGDASEKIWLELLQTYLPERYKVEY